MSKPRANNREVIRQRRKEVLTLLSQGMQGKDIASILKVDPGTISRDIRYLTSQSDNYMDNILEKTAPLMYQTSIGIVGDVLKESWNIYHNTNSDPSINWSHKIAALKLAKECGEGLFYLTRDGPTLFAVKQVRKRFDEIVEMDKMNRNNSNNFNPQILSE